ncbi:MAG: hypothetical protein AAF654_01765 [Myxococcota bacterium]
MKSFWTFLHRAFRVAAVLTNIWLFGYIGFLLLGIALTERRSFAVLASPGVFVFFGIFLGTYLANRWLQRRLEDYPRLLQNTVIANWLVLRLCCVASLRELIYGNTSGFARREPDWLEIGLGIALANGLFALLNFLGYTKVVRDRAEARFFVAMTKFSDSVGGGAIADERIIDILKKTSVIRQSIATTSGNSYSVSVPSLVAWPAESVRYYFGVHILTRRERVKVSGTYQYSTTRTWTAVWMCGAPADLTFTMTQKLFGGDFEVTPAPDSRIPREKIPELTDALNARGLTAVDVKNGSMLAIRPLKPKGFLFGVRPLEDQDIVETARTIEVWS